METLEPQLHLQGVLKFLSYNTHQNYFLLVSADISQLSLEDAMILQFFV